MAKKETIETVDETIIDPSKIAVNADTVDTDTTAEETKEEEPIAPASVDEPALKTEVKKEVKKETSKKEETKEGDPFDTDEFETKIMKATGIMHPTIDKLIAAIKEAEDDEAKEAAKKHLIWHIPAGAGCKHHDDLVAEVNAL
jgi:hypothetical protein